MLRRPVEQPQGLGPRRGIELARPRPDLDPCFDRPEPQIPPHGVARDLELARDAFGAPSAPVQLADLANHPRHKKADEQPKSSPQRVREQQAPHPKGRAKHVRDDHHSPPANFGVDEKTALGSKANRVTTRATALMAASQGNSNALSQTPPCSKSTG